jgi:RNA polymerase sigma-70 factor, ECF subfamily
VTLYKVNRVQSDLKNEVQKNPDWQRWLDEHAPGLLLYARQQASCEADAQDLLQEAIVESWKRQSTSEPPPLALVFATIRRRAIDLARSTKRRAGREIASLSEPPDSCWFDVNLEDRERAQLIQSAVKSLPSIYREVITLKIWGGLTFAEVARILGVPANTVSSRYRYALEELRKRVGEVLA